MKVALPPLSEEEELPYCPPSTKKVTNSPSGGTPALEATVAVKVTDCPQTDGFSEEATVVVVGTSGALG